MTHDHRRHPASRPTRRGPVADEYGEGHHGATDRQYILIALILAVMTAAEVTLSYIDVGPIFLPRC